MTDEATNVETVRRLNAAFLEAGYHDVARSVMSQGQWAISLPFRTVPRPVIWAAFEVARMEPLPCWTCWSTYDRQIGQDCLDGQCHHPDQARWPGRKILVAA